MKKKLFTKISLFPLTLVLILMSLGISSQAQQVVLRSVDDAVAWSEFTTRTATEPGILGGGNILANRYEVTEGETTTTHNVHAYVKFDLSGMAYRKVSHASFSTRGTAKAEMNTTLAVRRAGSAFSRDTTNWENKPGIGQEIGTKAYTTASARREYELNATRLIDYINEELAKGITEISFNLQHKSGDLNGINWIAGTTDGGGTWAPELLVELLPEFAFIPVADASAFKHLPETTAQTFRDNANIFVNKVDDDNLAVSYVKFHLKGLANKQISSADLSTRGAAVAEKEFTVQLRRAGGNFQRDTTNWGNRPNISGPKLATKLYTPSSLRRSYDPVGDELVKYINNELAKGNEYISFGLEYDSGDLDAGDWIGGMGNGYAWGPQLNVVPDYTQFASQPVTDAVAYEDPEADRHATNLFVSGEEGKRMISYVKFDISDFSGRVASSAGLTIRGGNLPAGETMVMKLTRSGNNFSRDTITWANKPATSGELATADYTGGIKEFTPNGVELINYINSKLKEGASVISFAIEWKSGHLKSNWIGGMGDGEGYRPILSIEFSFDGNLFSTADAVADQANPDVVWTARPTNLRVDGTTDAQLQSFVKFDISGFTGKEILGAAFSTRGVTTGADDRITIKLIESGTGFARDTTTWNNKPSVGAELASKEYDFASARREYTNLDAKLIEYINKHTLAGKTEIAFGLAYKSGGVDMLEWMGGKGDGTWGPELKLEVKSDGPITIATPRFAPAPGLFITSVDVVITTTTAAAQIYYTIDGTEPTIENGTLYTEPVNLTATDAIREVTIKARGFGEEMISSEIAEATYTVTPVSLPVFNPSPLVKYQESVEVTITVQPAGSVIRYSLDGGAPTTLYDGAILLTETTDIRAQAYNADFTFSTAIVEATYEIVETQPNPGVGPGGVGFADLSRANQPALSLWLRAHDLDLADGAKVTSWSDNSGNENHAHNDETGVGSQIPNTGEPWKAAPTFVANGLNGWPTLHFGTQFGGENSNVKNLIVDDADNLDGGAGISIFMVVKRNQMFGDFAGIFQKRDVRDQNNHASYILEMDGGANPNRMQFVIARDIFLKSLVEYNADDFYLVNVGLNSKHKLATFFSNGELKNSALYQQPIKNSHASVIIGGFQPIDLAEVIMFNSDVNMAQTVIIQNYLAAKYGLTGIGNVFYTNTDYVHDLIGVGRATDVTGNGFETHNLSYGAGLQLTATVFTTDGDFILAGHNGVDLNDNNVNKAWTRQWYIETAGNGGNVNLGFNFDADGITSDPSTDMRLYHRDSETAEWAALDITPTIDEKMLNFVLTDIQNGYYALGLVEVSTDEIALGSEKGGFALYPNPARERITVQMEDVFTGKVEVRILDIYGRLVRSEMVVKDAAVIQHELDVANLRNGTYMVELISQSKRSIKLFLVH